MAKHHLRRGNLAPVLAGLAGIFHCCRDTCRVSRTWGCALPCAQHLEPGFPRPGSLTWLFLLQKDTSGDYRKALLVLCGGED